MANNLQNNALSFTESRGAHQTGNRVSFGDLDFVASGDDLVTQLTLSVVAQTGDELILGNTNLLANASNHALSVSNGVSNQALVLNTTTTSEGVTTVTLSPGQGAVFNAQLLASVLNSLAFTNTSNLPSEAVRNVSIQVTDATQATHTQAVTIAVDETDDPITGTPTLTMQTPGVGTALSIVTTGVTDLDTANLQWTYAWAVGNTSGGWDAITGATSATYTPTVAQFGKKLQVTAIASDGISGHATQSFVLETAAVANNPPVLNTNSSTVQPSFTEDGTTPVVINASIELTDPRGVNIKSATIAFSSGGDPGKDVLAVSNLPQGLSAAMVNNALVITAGSGGVAASVMQEALRKVTFSSTSEKGDARVIQWSVTNVNDATGVGTNSLTYTTIDDPIVFTAGEPSNDVYENATGNESGMADLTLTLSDNDNVVRYDVTAMANLGWTETSSGSGTFTKQGQYGNLTLGNDNTVSFTVDDNAPEFYNLAAGQTAEEVFSVAVINDANITSVQSNLSFTVHGKNDAFTWSANTTSFSLAEPSGANNGAVSQSLSAAGLTVRGDDRVKTLQLSFNEQTNDQLNWKTSTSLLGNATTTITLTDQTQVQVTVSRSGNTTTLAFGLPGTTTTGLTAAQVQELVHGLSFANPSDAVSNQTRNLTFTAFGPQNNTLGTQAFTLQVSNGDDPFVGDPSFTGSALVNQTLKVDVSGVTDADGPITWTYQWQSSTTGTGAWSNIAGATGATYTTTSNDLGKYIQVVATAKDNNNGHSATQSYTYKTSSQVSSNQPAVLTLSTTPPTFAEAAGTPVVLDATLTLADPYSQSITSAEVGISAASVKTGDTLSLANGYTLPTGISLQVVNGTTLKLTGKASAADYQTALRQVVFNTSSELAADRAIEWKVTNEVNMTATPTSTVKLNMVDDTFSVSSSAGDIPPNVTEDSTTTTVTQTLTLSDDDGTTSYDLAGMQAQGWATTDNGATYTKQGTYGSLSLNTSTGVVSFTLDNTLAATNGLGDVNSGGAATSATESFQVAVKSVSVNAGVADTTLTPTFSFQITGHDDAPTMTSVPEWATPLAFGQTQAFKVSDLLAKTNATDAEGGLSGLQFMSVNANSGITVEWSANGVNGWTTPNANTVLSMGTIIRLSSTLVDGASNVQAFTFAALDGAQQTSATHTFVIDVLSQYPNLDSLFSFFNTAEARTDGGTEDYVLVNGEVMRLNAFKSTTTDYTFTAEAGAYNYLVVGGGGGGGSYLSGGGGGAGGLLKGTYTADATTTTAVTVGAGGAGGFYDPVLESSNLHIPGESGGNSSIAAWNLTASGGGGGGASGNDSNRDGGPGGSGGGGGGASAQGDGGIGFGGSGTNGQGNAGGNSSVFSNNNPGGSNTQPNLSAGGGGGAGETGGSGTSAGPAGDGGDGVQSNITGENLYYAGGGGGGARASSVLGQGGQGGGGSGGQNGSSAATTIDATDGQANTGGGGGGGGGSNNVKKGSGGNGGSGVVYVSFDTGANEAELLGWLQSLVGTDTTLESTQLHTYLNNIENAWEASSNPDVWWTAQNVKNAVLG